MRVSVFSRPHNWRGYATSRSEVLGRLHTSCCRRRRLCRLPACIYCQFRAADGEIGHKNSGEIYFHSLAKLCDLLSCLPGASSRTLPRGARKNMIRMPKDACLWRFNAHTFTPHAQVIADAGHKIEISANFIAVCIMLSRSFWLPKSQICQRQFKLIYN